MASKINFFAPSELLLRAKDLIFKIISVTSSLTPAIVENSWTTPFIFIEVIAAPCKEESKTLLRVLPSVKPKPLS